MALATATNGYTRVKFIRQRLVTKNDKTTLNKEGQCCKVKARESAAGPDIGYFYSNSQLSHLA